MEYNVYCDESCHLVSNDSKYMLIGAVYCPKYKLKKVNEYIEHLKSIHGHFVLHYIVFPLLINYV